MNLLDLLDSSKNNLKAVILEGLHQQEWHLPLGSFPTYVLQPFSQDH